MAINVALDGPSGAGKSTIAKLASKKLGFVYVDTGAMYRTVAYYIASNGFDPKDTQRVVSELDNITIELKYIDGEQAVLLNGENVSDRIRTPEISMAASSVSAIPQVREFLLETQRSIARENNIIMDGRDIGTVVLPNAQVKIFLTASAEIRAQRRFKELSEKGDPSTYEQVLADINERDYNDTHRETAPLKKAPDAVEIDSSFMTIEQVAERIAELAEKAVSENASASEAAKKKSAAAEKKQRTLMPINPIKKGKRINPMRQGFYNLARPFVRFIFTHWFELTYEGVENVPRDGGNIFASNHRSYGDPVFIALMTRVPISYMAKEELFKQNIFFTLLIKAWGAFPVVRGTGDTAVIDTSVEKLNSGRNLVIFPEGTRSKDGRVGKGKTGVALIAAVAQTTVVPVGISFEGEKLCRRKRVVVRYGKPIIPAELGVTDTSTKNLKLLKKSIMDSITSLVN